MTKIYTQAYFDNKIIPIESANLSIASSAVLYGLSVYTVFPIIFNQNKISAFRLQDRYTRLINSAKIIGIDTFEKKWNFEKFFNTVKELVTANDIHELSFIRANIFMVRDGVLITPSQSSDILEGINRKTVIEIAQGLNIPVIEREIDLTEIYIADELFACGTSTFIAPIIEVDKRKIGDGPITKKIKDVYDEIFLGENEEYNKKYFIDLSF